MKDSTESINRNVFTYFPPIQTNHNLPCFFFANLKQKTQLFKAQILSSLTTLGIGSIFLLAIYLFLVQLAEHGWQ